MARTPAVQVYVLKNTPLRLERVATKPGNPNPPTTSQSPSQHDPHSQVFLHDIRSHYQQLSLEHIPDDQVLVFWAECARFSVSPSPVLKGEPPEPWMDILAVGSNGENAGSTRCYENTPGNMEYHERDFVLIGTNEGYVGAEKFVLGLEPTGEGGIWSRQSAGRIGEEQWNRATRVTRLILLR